MKRVIFLSSLCLLIGMGLGIMGAQLQSHKGKELRIKRIVNLEEIIKRQEKEMRQLRTKLKQQEVDVTKLRTKLSEQKDEMRQLQTGINENKPKQTAQDGDLEEVLEAIGDKRVFFP